MGNGACTVRIDLKDKLQIYRRSPSFKISVGFNNVWYRYNACLWSIKEL